LTIFQLQKKKERKRETKAVIVQNVKILRYVCKLGRGQFEAVFINIESALYTDA